MVARTPIQIRMSVTKLEYFDDLALGYGLSRADVIRAHLAVGENNRRQVDEILKSMTERM